MAKDHNLDRFIPGSPKGLYRGLKFGTCFNPGSEMPVVGAALGPLLRGESVDTNVIGELRRGGVIIKSKTTDGRLLDLYGYKDEYGEEKYIIDRASFIVDENGQTRVVEFNPDEDANVRYLEVWSGLFQNEMGALQLIQDNAFPRHGGVNYVGDTKTIVSANPTGETIFKPQAVKMPEGIVAMLYGVVIWEVALWRMPFTKEIGSELIIRGGTDPGKDQWKAIARPGKTLIEPANTGNFRDDWDFARNLADEEDARRLAAAKATQEAQLRVTA